MLEKLKTHNTFIPAFLAGVVAITISQPFEVIRSKIVLNKENIGYFNVFKNHYRANGLRGFFIGFVPRLFRKPINSGICWTVIESIKIEE